LLSLLVRPEHGTRRVLLVPRGTTRVADQCTVVCEFNSRGALPLALLVRNREHAARVTNLPIDQDLTSTTATTNTQPDLDFGGAGALDGDETVTVVALILAFDLTGQRRVHRRAEDESDGEAQGSELG
jgi:hypothetical protein